MEHTNVETTQIHVNPKDIVLIRFTDEIENEEARQLFEEMRNAYAASDNIIIGVRSGVYLDAMSKAAYKEWLESELALLAAEDTNEDIL